MQRQRGGSIYRKWWNPWNNWILKHGRLHASTRVSMLQNLLLRSRRVCRVIQYRCWVWVVCVFRSVCWCRGCSLFPRSLNYRLVVLLLRITVVTCDRTGTIVDIRKDAGGYPNDSHARRLNRLGSQFSVFYSSNVYG